MPYDVAHLPEQTGRIALITGANTGLGYCNALDLAAKGAKVVMACRNEDRALKAMQLIRGDLGDADLEFLKLDLGSLDAVRAAVSEYRSRHEHLDVLVNNAGIMMTPYVRTVDGLEGQMAANYWGHFLLTMSLIDLMPDTTASRVVTLSSLAHRQGTKQIRFDDISWEQGYSRVGAYRQTKLACLLFTLELDRRLQAAERHIVSAGAHPGFSTTELARSIPRVLQYLTRYTIGAVFAQGPDQGSLPTLVAAIADNVTGGDYFGPQGRWEMKGPPGPAHIDDCARDAKAARRLWDLSAEITGADLPY